MLVYKQSCKNMTVTFILAYEYIYSGTIHLGYIGKYIYRSIIMLLNIIQCLICILAVYGLLTIIHNISEFVSSRLAGHRPKVRVVLLVQDAEEQIEYIVRYVVKQEYADRALSDKKLIIVDMDSTDNTYVLLEKLQNNFPSIQVIRMSDMESVFKDFVFSPPAK